MPVARPGPKPTYTEEFLVKLRPDQRRALDCVAQVGGISRSAALRRFIDQGFATFTAAVGTIHGASSEAVAQAVTALEKKENDGHA